MLHFFHHHWFLFIFLVQNWEQREKRRKSEFFKTENPTETRNRRHLSGGFTPFYPLVAVGAFSYPLQAAAVFHFTQITNFCIIYLQDKTVSHFV
jgi:hypothetical protein